MGFPGKTARCIMWWQLRDYTFFPDMPRMAELKEQTVAQSLLEFEFDGGRKCQLDASCDEGGNYKLSFSFDKAKDAIPLASLLKMKLEAY